MTGHTGVVGNIASRCPPAVCTLSATSKVISAILSPSESASLEAASKALKRQVSPGKKEVSALMRHPG